MNLELSTQMIFYWIQAVTTLSTILQKKKK